MVDFGFGFSAGVLEVLDFPIDLYVEERLCIWCLYNPYADRGFYGISVTSVTPSPTIT